MGFQQMEGKLEMQEAKAHAIYTKFYTDISQINYIIYTFYISIYLNLRVLV